MAPKKKIEGSESAIPEVTEQVVVAEVAAPGAPAPVMVTAPVTGTPTEIYGQLRTIVSQDGALINQQVPALLELMRSAENAETPLLLRVRFLEFVANNVANLRDASALKKIVTSLVKVIGGEDNTPQLLVSAVQCLSGLGPVSMLDKSWEYLSREGADILMQVVIDKDAFSEAVRQAARKSLDSLIGSAFRPVLTKLLHWLSDDREEDEEEQISKERHMALAILSRLALSPSLRSHWTEDVEEDATALLLRILNIVDAREFSQLARVAAALPKAHQQGGIPLLQAFLSSHKLDSERSVESAAIIGRFVSTKGREFDMLSALESGKLLSSNVDADSLHGALVARLVLLAVRLAPAESAVQLFPYVVAQLEHLLGNGSSLQGNLSTLEAFMFAVIALGRHTSVQVLQKLNEETLNATMTAFANNLAKIEPEAIFAVKKMVREHKAGNEQGELLACLHNLRIISGSFSAKHLPMSELCESWARKRPLPTLKRAREDGNGALPPPPGTASANRQRTAGVSRHKEQRDSRQRVQSNHSRHALRPRH